MADTLWLLEEGEMRGWRHGRLVAAVARPCVLDASVLLADEVVGADIRPCTWR